ncbi:2-hydroxyacid dehydrogenase [Nisaea sediminum]|uniref:2-hydroxyacid dehydrogenase n=1 Tax=Nisaea sediminum TaxID=2775867 RepID=UPI001868F22E|nr:NAD(P)-dependent oxidoreductase [Nisaea sediminum]
MTFKVATTRDLMNAAGEPIFDPALFDLLKANPEIEWEWLPEDVTEITPDIAARYDAIHINLPRVTAASVGGDDCRVKIFARNGVGFDTVDLEACKAKGIAVTNTPIAIRRPVAVAALTLIFALSGKLFKKDEIVREGRWNARVDHMGIGLTGRTLGMIGAGGIGQELIPLARPFFKEIQVYDPYVEADVFQCIGARKVGFEDVLAAADFLLVACPLNDETRHMINADAFRRMKPTACFVNVARGPIHDEAALAEALASGEIAAAGLDVTEQEPISPDSPLLAMDNTIITPHALCWTDECFDDIARTALQSILDVSEGKEPVHRVI